MTEPLTRDEEEALLGRAVEPLLTSADREAFAGRVCLITGAGGSVGSELARQIAGCRPSLVALVDHSEHALVRSEHELKETAAGTSFEVLLCDITRAASVARAIRRINPDVIFHAAAYKHVTMAERAICAAVRVNVLGTDAVLTAAREVGARFVLVSSDKAAAPRSVMGATKRLAELLTLARPHQKSRPSVVRFGNVLASSGSFVDLMRDRIRRGRSLLVTDPDATRFFMTVTEAASLVMKASTLAQGGETFWLDMGEQVHIGDLAARLLDVAARSGFRRVPIEVIGLRPGEKLVEQLASWGWRMQPTAHARIRVARQGPVAAASCVEVLRALRRGVARDDALATLKALMTKVADFEPSAQAWAAARAGEPEWNRAPRALSA